VREEKGRHSLRSGEALVRVSATFSADFDCISGSESKLFELRSEKPRSGIQVADAIREANC
jgi:hypothetical protein